MPILGEKFPALAPQTQAATDSMQQLLEPRGTSILPHTISIAGPSANIYACSPHQTSSSTHLAQQPAIEAARHFNHAVIAETHRNPARRRRERRFHGKIDRLDGTLAGDSTVDVQIEYYLRSRRQGS